MSAVAFWRRCAASVTGFAHKYRDDSFLRTEINLIALQFGYAALVVAVSTVALFVLYHEVLRGVTDAVVAALTASSSPSPESVLAELEAVRTRNIVELVAVIFATAMIFGYLVTRFALTPARNALAAQKRFIGDIAHELRTPLSVIRTNTEVRLFDTDVSREARELHQSNLEELDRISSLIDNLLTLNSFVRPEQMPFGNVDLGKVARRVLDRFDDLARTHHVRTKLSAARNHPAWGNAAALEQILMNLVKNAIQHTRGGEVRVTVGPSTSGALELVVSDTGSGIRREDLLHIFEPFYRGDRARTRAGGAGSGLGLAIVNELILLHRGRIRIQSAPEIGTRVTVTLPYGHPARGKRRERQAPYSTTEGEAAADFTREGGFLR